MYKLEKDYSDFIPKMNYRKGKGAFEGVVIHYTDSPNSIIRNEVKFMKEHWKNAFVHAFANDEIVIETADPIYKCWGAGSNANSRFLSIEQCVAHTKEKFMDTVNNTAQWAAELLYSRKLGISAAQMDGTGTIWTHSQVTKFMGGTTHTDPDAYWKSWQYSYKDFLALITEKYNALGKDLQLESQLGVLFKNKVITDTAAWYEVVKNGATSTWVDDMLRNFVGVMIKNPEIVVSVLMECGIVTDRKYWQDVVSGAIQPNPSYIKIVVERMAKKLA